MLQALFTAARRRTGGWGLSQRGEQQNSELTDDSALRAADTDELHSVAKSEIARGKERLGKRVEEMQAFTESEILACNAALSTIFDSVGNLITEANSAAANSINRYEHVTSSFAKGMREDSLAQEGSAKQVLHLADGIEEAVGAIDELTRFSNLLAINARIEAARLGKQGAAFAVIADRMRELSGSIKDVADQVKSAIGTVREAIPPLMQRANSMHIQTQSFIDKVADQVKSVSQQSDTETANNEALDTVMQLSNKALAHLQFQDRLNQKLMAINTELRVVDERVCRVLDGNTDLEPLADTVLPGDGAPGSGVVMLF